MVSVLWRSIDIQVVKIETFSLGEEAVTVVQWEVFAYWKELCGRLDLKSLVKELVPRFSPFERHGYRAENAGKTHSYRLVSMITTLLFHQLHAVAVVALAPMDDSSPFSFAAPASTSLGDLPLISPIVPSYLGVSPLS